MYYMSFIAVTGANCGTFRVIGLKEFISNVILFCSGYVLRTFFLAKMTAAGVNYYIIIFFLKHFSTKKVDQ